MLASLARRTALNFFKRLPVEEALWRLAIESIEARRIGLLVIDSFEEMRRIGLFAIDSVEEMRRIGLLVIDSIEEVRRIGLPTGSDENETEDFRVPATSE